MAMNSGRGGRVWATCSRAAALFGVIIAAPVFAQPIITVMQESAPGVGDFTNHVIGTARAWATDLTPREFYNYKDCHYQGGEIVPFEGMVQTFFGDTSSGLCLFQLHDAPGGGGARAECRVRVAPRPAGDSWQVFDHGWSWQSCGSGAAQHVDFNVGTSGSCDFGIDRFPLVGSWTMDVEFTQQLKGCSGDCTNCDTPPIEGLFDWAVRSSSGTTLYVNLQEDRRVRFVPCNAPAVSSDLVVSVGQSAQFLITPGGSGPFTYQWRKNGVHIVGSTSRTLTFTAVSCADAGKYDCIVTNACGIVTTRAAKLSICPADLNCDGFVTGDDFDEFAVLFIRGDLGADFNGDGFVTGDDFDSFSDAFTAGC